MLKKFLLNQVKKRIIDEVKEAATDLQPVAVELWYIPEYDQGNVCLFLRYKREMNSKQEKEKIELPDKKQTELNSLMNSGFVNETKLKYSSLDFINLILSIDGREKDRFEIAGVKKGNIHKTKEVNEF